ncbi:MAG: hybrid sensor histidine kinase/response regulator [Cyanobacteria bacterium P01_G01_bin.54]
MSYSVLSVDDDRSNFYVIEALLFKEGYDLTAVDSGQAALAHLEQSLPDIILLDVMMPNMNGIEVCKILKSQEPTRRIPILMVTALDAKEDMAACLEAGADDFLSKPVNGIELKARVRSLLRIKEQQDEIQAALENQAAIAQLREDMASMIVHDFRNPLNSILVGCELLKNTDLAKAQLRQINKIDHAQRQLLNLTDDLLVMSKVDAGHLVLQREATELCELIREAIADWESLAQRHALTLALELPTLDYTATLDPKLCRRVLDNLLSNAIKFSEQQTTITVRLAVSSGQPEPIQLQVMDQGMGVDENMRQQIFQKYETGQAIKGICQLGLGLAFCKMVAEAHGGCLSVQDNCPQGSIFTLALPTTTSEAVLASTVEATWS